MTNSLSQDQKSGQAHDAAGPTALVLASFSAIEGLSELFEIRVEAASDGQSRFRTMLGWARPSNS